MTKSWNIRPHVGRSDRRMRRRARRIGLHRRLHEGRRAGCEQGLATGNGCAERRLLQVRGTGSTGFPFGGCAAGDDPGHAGQGSSGQRDLLEDERRRTNGLHERWNGDLRKVCRGATVGGVPHEQSGTSCSGCLDAGPGIDLMGPAVEAVVAFDAPAARRSQEEP